MRKSIASAAVLALSRGRSRRWPRIKPDETNQVTVSAQQGGDAKKPQGVKLNFKATFTSQLVSSARSSRAARCSSEGRRYNGGKYPSARRPR